MKERQEAWEELQEGNKLQFEKKIEELEKQLSEKGTTQEDTSFRKVVKEQLNVAKITEKIVSVIKSKEFLVRETVEIRRNA